MEMIILKLCFLLCCLQTIVARLRSCENIAEVYSNRIGLKELVPETPVVDTELEICKDSFGHSLSKSCCTKSMEDQFLVTSRTYLTSSLDQETRALKTRIKNSLLAYEQHMLHALDLAKNHTSKTLHDLYQIPKEAHGELLDNLFMGFQRYLLSREESLTEDIEDFFAQLFPVVFEYVLSDPAKTAMISQDFRDCLLGNHDTIRPFGNVPFKAAKRLLIAFRRARAFSETLQGMTEILDSTSKMSLSKACIQGTSRLEYCSMCAGHSEVKPCRAMCLNVMRGCLANIAELSDPWDELVVAFQNLGMFRKWTAQEVLGYFTGNVTEAIMKSMNDLTRVYEVSMKKCQTYVQSQSSEQLVSKRFSTARGVTSFRPTSHTETIRSDVNLLIRQLDESKGFYLRLADGHCRDSDMFDQEMRSSDCWNGTSVGRYMLPVPDSKILSQVGDNREVRVTLFPDKNVLQLKERMSRMRKNLSILMNEEMFMVNDQSFSITGSGERDFNWSVIDDEDYYNLASGSGSGSEEVDEEDGGISRGNGAPTPTRKPKPEVTETKPGKDRSKGSPGSASHITSALLLLLCCVVLSALCRRWTSL